MKSIVILLSSVFSLSAASVQFTHSALYDIYDFVGVDEVPITQCDYGCLIFASITKNNEEAYTENLIIHDSKDNNCSIAELARKFNEKSSQKTPLTIWGPASISVLNFNLPNEKFSPIVLYIIEKTKAEEIEHEYEMYDASNMNGITVTSKIATVMSAEAFTLKPRTIGIPNGITAWLAGFDNAFDNNVDACPAAFSAPADEVQFTGFILNIAGPIISLSFLERNALQIDATIQSTEEFALPVYDLSFDGFITSDGYNGCLKPLAGGVQSFRSPLYNTSKSYLLGRTDNTNEYHVSIKLEPSLDDKHSVNINDLSSNDPPFLITGNNVVPIEIAKTQHIEIVFENLDADQGFLMTYTTSEVVDTTSGATSTDPPTTTSIPSSTTMQTATTSGSSGIEGALLLTIGALAVIRLV